MFLRDILKTKGPVIHSIGPQESLAEVVQRLVQHNCGSLVVLDGEKMVGIITERDILRTMASLQESLAEVTVESRMTRDVFTASPDDELGKVMGQMTQHRIRHLPVLQEAQLVGMISIGDLVKAHHDQLSVENHYLKNYIQS